MGAVHETAPPQTFGVSVANSEKTAQHIHHLLKLYCVPVLLVEEAKTDP